LKSQKDSENSREIHNVYVNEGGMAIVVCPHCGKTKTFNAAKFMGRKEPLKIRCTCRSVIRVFFEFRRAYRKETSLTGSYAKLPTCKEWGKMLVKNVSLTGIGFATITMHNLKKNDELEVKFTLDVMKRPEIKKRVVVKVVKDKYIGCEFEDRGQFVNELGFYLMP
jgi:hypothetical protein